MEKGLQAFASYKLVYNWNLYNVRAKGNESTDGLAVFWRTTCSLYYHYFHIEIVGSSVKFTHTMRITKLTGTRLAWWIDSKVEFSNKANGYFETTNNLKSDNIHLCVRKLNLMMHFRCLIFEIYMKLN